MIAWWRLFARRRVSERRRMEAELRDELAFHVEQEAAARVARGMSPAEGRRTTLRDLGGVTQVTEAVRRERARWSLDVGRDLTCGARMLRRAPVTTTAVVMMLALGIGSSTIVFSVVDPAFIRPVPYDDPDSLVLLNEQSPLASLSPVAYEDYLDWRRESTAFSALAAQNRETFNLTGMGDPQQVLGSNVSASLFDVLRVRPFMGRLFTPDDDRPNAPPVVVITHASWANRFHRDTSIVGKTVVLDAVARTIVGVLPPRTSYPAEDAAGEIFSPLGRLTIDLAGRGNRTVNVIGRLRPGVALERARAEMDGIAGQLASAYPADREVRIRIDRYRDRLVSSSRLLMIGLWGSVMLVWLVACTNTALMMAIRGASRSREFAVRLALGASRGRLIRQVLVEHLILTIVAGALGMLAAASALPLVVRWLPADLPGAADVGLTARVLVYAGLATVAAAILAGIFPAWQAIRTPLSQTVRDGMAPIAVRPRLRAGLVVGQLALSQLLLAGAALSVSTFVALLHVNVGFQPDGVAAVLYYLPDATYVSREQVVGFHEALLDRIGRLPGIESAGLLTPPPFGFGGGRTDLVIDGRDDTVRVDGFRASPGALSALGVPILRGRFFDGHDGRDSPAVIVVDERFAETYFAGLDPLRQSVRLERSGRKLPVVGVAGHIVTRSLKSPNRPQVYLPLFGMSLHFTSVIVRTTTGDPLARMPDIRAMARDLDPNLPLFNAASMATLVGDTIRPQRLAAYATTTFAAAALGLATMGLAAILAFSVALRRRDLGVRLALGAEPRHLVARLVTYGGGLTLAGVGVGLAGGVVLSQVFRARVAAVGATSVTAVAVSTAILLVTGIIASYVPARRIASIDPAEILRRE